MSELPIAPLARIIKKSGAQRISEDASKELAKKLEEIGEEAARRAVELSKHANRKTVTRKDIELAFKHCNC